MKEDLKVTIFLGASAKSINFIVLECNGTNSYARIHKTICGYAKKPNTKTKYTFCHGYFKTYYEAREFAQSLSVKSIYDCRLCSPKT